MSSVIESTTDKTSQNSLAEELAKEQERHRKAVSAEQEKHNRTITDIHRRMLEGTREKFCSVIDHQIRSVDPSKKEKNMENADSTPTITVEIVGDVAHVILTDKQYMLEGHIYLTGAALLAVVDSEQAQNVVLDFCNVEYMSGLLLAKLITLNKKIKDTGGKRLHLCEMHSDIYDVFAITKLHKFFTICTTFDEAHKALSK